MANYLFILPSALILATGDATGAAARAVSASWIIPRSQHIKATPL
jgi:hypothetical protein